MNGWFRCCICCSVFCNGVFRKKVLVISNCLMICVGIWLNSIFSSLV